MKDEVVLFWGERNRYDMSFELPGARIVEWGIPGPGAAYQLDAAITDRTCAVAAVFQPLLKRGLSVSEMCRGRPRPQRARDSGRGGQRCLRWPT